MIQPEHLHGLTVIESSDPAAPHPHRFGSDVESLPEPARCQHGIAIPSRTPCLFEHLQVREEQKMNPRIHQPRLIQTDARCFWP